MASAYQTGADKRVPRQRDHCSAPYRDNATIESSALTCKMTKEAQAATLEQIKATLDAKTRAYILTAQLKKLLGPLDWPIGPGRLLDFCK